ncbi:MAG: DUF4270 domain-containing protein [Prevotella sp.]|nr:DUF4270 domain-containing protein [Prevotella sp.]MBR6494556.1 DUF4270 domain-containing protein [Prevotella sp.]
MKYKFLMFLVSAAAIFASCDDTTNDIGTSLLHNMDNLAVTTDSFVVSSRSIAADSVYSRATTGYLGRIKDPETGTYVTGNFMTQFHMLEDYANLFPKADSIVSRIDGQIVADSCEIRLFYSNFYGDSLATMKLTVHEMAKPMLENQKYYSSFDPKAEGYLRSDGIHQGKAYTLVDLALSSEERQSSNYTNNIRIVLDKEYTDRDGNAYNNFGTYLLNTYYKNPSAFGNSLKFMNEILPGFYFEHTGGIGSMAYVGLTRLNVYYRFLDSDTVCVGAASFAGTEEVLQATKIENDKQKIKSLVADNTCTYLKTPAGIFTELTLPVDEILRGHEKDSLNTAKIVLPRINNEKQSDYAFTAPTSLLMIPRDSLYSFFEHNQLVNSRSSFLASNTVSTSNSYTFNNISQLINLMNANRSSENWNKVVVIPVTVDTSGKVSHNMALNSTRLVGGSENPYAPIKITVIYSQFK